MVIWALLSFSPLPQTQLRETSVNGRGLAIGSRAHMDGENLAEVRL